MLEVVKGNKKEFHMPFHSLETEASHGPGTFRRGEAYRLYRHLPTMESTAMRRKFPLTNASICVTSECFGDDDTVVSTFILKKLQTQNKLPTLDFINRRQKGGVMAGVSISRHLYLWVSFPTQ